MLLNVGMNDRGMSLDNICLFTDEENFANDNEKALTKMPWLVAKPHSAAKNFEVNRFVPSPLIMGISGLSTKRE